MIHLSGYVMPEDEIPSPSELMTDSDEEDEEEKEELQSEEDTSPPGLSRFWSFSEWVVTLHSLFSVTVWTLIVMNFFLEIRNIIHPGRYCMSTIILLLILGAGP